VVTLGARRGRRYLGTLFRLEFGSRAGWLGWNVFRLTGLAENVEYVITPAVIVFFIGSYASAILGAPPETQPLFWIAFYILFVGLNYIGVELSCKFSLVITVS
jgi:ethanolamine permease